MVWGLVNVVLEDGVMVLEYVCDVVWCFLYLVFLVVVESKCLMKVLFIEEFCWVIVEEGDIFSI